MCKPLTTMFNIGTSCDLWWYLGRYVLQGQNCNQRKGCFLCSPPPPHTGFSPCHCHSYLFMLNLLGPFFKTFLSVWAQCVSPYIYFILSHYYPQMICSTLFDAGYKVRWDSHLLVYLCPLGIFERFEITLRSINCLSELRRVLQTRISR